MDSIFIDNKYSKTYFSLCNKAINRPLPDGYYETHHIIPRSLGGKDTKSNLVALTAREHFIAHILLTKMLEGTLRYKMVRALVRMAKTGGTSARYALARKIISDNSKGANNPSFGRRWWHHFETKETAYLLPTDPVPDGYLIGLPFQRGGVKKGSITINDGVNQTFISPGDDIPEGWVRGRAYQTPKENLKKAAKNRHTKEKDSDHSNKMKNRINIFNGTIYKKIHLADLQSYLDDGWIVKGQPNKRCRSIRVLGVIYESYPLAAKALNINTSTVSWRVNSMAEKWREWCFVSHK